jgi:hypothetical protein
MHNYFIAGVTYVFRSQGAHCPGSAHICSCAVRICIYYLLIFYKTLTDSGPKEQSTYIPRIPVSVPSLKLGPPHPLFRKRVCTPLKGTQD